MATKTRVRQNKIPHKIMNAIVEGLEERKIPVKVEYEKSALRGLYRFYVVSDKFDRLSNAERQDIVWRIIKNNLEPADTLRITMVMTLTEKEARGDFS